jgi:hypothetical protein
MSYVLLMCAASYVLLTQIAASQLGRHLRLRPCPLTVLRPVDNELSVYHIKWFSANVAHAAWL